MEKKEMLADIIKSKEIEMWDAALHRDSEQFRMLIDSNAVFVCGGGRCTGSEYADIIHEFNLSGYEILAYETVLITEQIVQNHYVIETKVPKEEIQVFAGQFHITTTWQLQGDLWKVIYNMDSRIMG